MIDKSKIIPAIPYAIIAIMSILVIYGGNFLYQNYKFLGLVILICDVYLYYLLTHQKKVWLDYDLIFNKIVDSGTGIALGLKPFNEMMRRNNNGRPSMQIESLTEDLALFSYLDDLGSPVGLLAHKFVLGDKTPLLSIFSREVEQLGVKDYYKRSRDFTFGGSPANAYKQLRQVFGVKSNDELWKVIGKEKEQKQEENDNKK